MRTKAFVIVAPKRVNDWNKLVSIVAKPLNVHSRDKDYLERGTGER